MRKRERKRIRRWYFDRYVFWAVHRFFCRKMDKVRGTLPTPRNEIEAVYYELIKIAQDAIWMEAYQEAIAWYYGIGKKKCTAIMPAKGKVSSKTIQVKLKEVIYSDER